MAVQKNAFSPDRQQVVKARIAKQLKDAVLPEA